MPSSFALQHMRRAVAFIESQSRDGELRLMPGGSAKSRPIYRLLTFQAHVLRNLRHSIDGDCQVVVADQSSQGMHNKLNAACNS